MPYLGIFDSNLKRILSYLKSAPSNLFNSKISGRKQKYLNLGPQTPYLGIFRLELKTILSYLKSAPSNLSNFKIFWKTENN